MLVADGQRLAGDVGGARLAVGEPPLTSCVITSSTTTSAPAVLSKKADANSARS